MEKGLSAIVVMFERKILKNEIMSLNIVENFDDLSRVCFFGVGYYWIGGKKG